MKYKSLFLIIIILVLPVFVFADKGLTPDEKALLTLLDEYKSRMPDIAQRMLNAKDNETVRFGADEQRLINETASFFNKLLQQGKGTQAYQTLRGTVPNWKTEYLGIERALMMGRALIVQKVLKETLI
ncbi:MAG: hypothetical protein N3A62_01280, partial [Thermodesulfovibrionales bacterium]|nr:hypothetical protein [Thermodesulfovibrionales bacterium]